MVEQPESCIIFREVQDLHNKLFMFSVFYPAVLVWGIEIYILFFGRPVWAQNISYLYLFMLLIVFGVLFPMLFYAIKHITEVRKDGIYIRLMPFNRSFKKIPFYMVEECKVQAYDPFTGKDMEASKAPRRVNLVVILKLISGKRMLISSKKPEELQRAITQAAALYS